MFYAVETSLFKIFKILKLSYYNTKKCTYMASKTIASTYRLYVYSHHTGLHENYNKTILAILLKYDNFNTLKTINTEISTA